MKKFILMLLFLSAVAGCSSKAREHSLQEISQLKVGEVNKSEVLAVLGLPNEKRKTTLNNGSFEIWTYFQHGNTTFMLPAGGTGNNGMTDLASGGLVPLFSSSGNKVAGILVFDENGVLIDAMGPEKESE